MTITITKAIEEAYRKYLNQTVDTDIFGVPILRKNTWPYAGETHSGLVDFAAGWQAKEETLPKLDSITADLINRNDVPQVVFGTDTLAAHFPESSRRE